MTRKTPAYQFLLFLLTVLISHTVFGQRKIVVKQLEFSRLPKGIKYEGKINTAVSWIDSLGYNITILTETGNYENAKFEHENGGGDAELFAYHFLVKDDSAVQNWKVYDYIADCPVDMEVAFLKSTFQVTDLDQNGVAEIWMMYKTECRGGVDPFPMKIIMYEGAKKYAIRGNCKVLTGIDDTGKKHFSGGDYQIDKAFNDSPKVFLAFAKQMWMKNVIQ